MIIGLDLSLTHTGWVVISNIGKVINFGTIIPKKLRHARRLNFIKTKLLKVIKRYNPVLAIIEGYAYSPNANMAFSIGENGGVVKLLLFRKCVSYTVVAPKTLKKFAASNGNASKKQMEKAIKLRWKEEFNTEHEVDAFALAILGKYVLSGDYSDLGNKELEAVMTVIKDVSNQNFSRRLK